MTTNQKHHQSNRLQFIDMARSIAILLMLEGHFTGAALNDAFRDSQYPLYSIWAAIHGLTKPLFFIVTGLVFTYLLLANKDHSFRENPRVKIGLKRVIQLLFWGYLIQLNLLGILKAIKYEISFNLEWLGAFHVLQSLALGILFIILIYGLYNLIKRGSILWYYVGAALLAIFFHGELLYYIQQDQEALIGSQQIAQYWPKKAPAFVQNMFYGKFSDFSFVTTLPLILMGSILGIIIRTYEKYVREFWFALILIVAGLILKIFANNLMWLVDTVFDLLNMSLISHFQIAHYSVARFGEVSMVIGLLIWIEKYATSRSPLFLKIGQNTFAIYVVHIIILYGGIFGIGLKPRVFDHNLHPFYAALISLAALLFFALFTKYIEPLERFYFTALQKLKLIKTPKKQ